MNRSQRRKAMNRRNRGRGLTRQYTSKRANDRYGRNQRTVKRFSPDDWNALLKGMETVEISDNPSDDLADAPTEEYVDHAVDLVDDNGSFDLLGDDDFAGSIAPESVLANFDADRVDEVLSSGAREAVALINSGDYDDVLDEVRAAEVAGKNRVTVLRALDARKQ